MRKTKKNAGNILLIVTGISLALGIGIFAIQKLLPSLSEQTLKSGDVLQYNLALNSVLDYTAYAVQKRWCLTDDLQQNPTCSATDTRNTERLLFSNETASFVKEKFSLASSAAARLQQIELTANIRGNDGNLLLARSHPLYVALEKIPAEVRAVKIKIRRVDNINMPSTDHMTYISIDVELVSGTGFRSLRIARNPQISGLFSYFRRELSSMALVIANDLHLDRGTFTASPPIGNAFIPYIAKDNTAPGPRGVVFQSPVFVNGSIHLPSKDDINLGNAYSPVVFGGKTYLGNGQIKQNQNAFVPNRAGTNERIPMFSNLSFMGGFKDGIEVDGERDKGLDVLAGLASGSIPNLSLMNQCIERSKAITNLVNTKNSSLIAKTISNNMSGSNKSRVVLGFGVSSSNEFLPQSGTGVSTSIKNQSGSWASISGNTSSGPIMKLKAQIPGGFFVEADLSRGTNLVLRPDLASSIQTSLAPGGALHTTRQQKRDAANNISPNLSQARQNLLDFYSAHTISTPNPITNLHSSDVPSGEMPTFNNLKNKYNAAKTAEDEKVTAEANFDAAQTKLNSLTSNAPEIEIKLQSVTQSKDGTNYTQPNQLELVVETTNGAPIDNLALEITGYELGTEQGISIRSSSGPSNERTKEANRNFNGEIAITYTASGNSVLPSWLSSNWSLSSQVSRSASPSLSIDGPIDNSINYGYLTDACNVGGEGGSAFSLGDWAEDFSSQTRHSWHFANPRPNIPVYNWNPGLSPHLVLGTPPTEPCSTVQDCFKVHSIVSDCRIPSTAPEVFGFYTCDKLTIEARTTPLRIIGSFIVSSMTIHPDALEAGIVWSNIYHPEAVQRLRQRNILRGSTSCAIPSQPAWHPNPSFAMLSNTFKCSPVILRSLADNWTWTQVDPQQAVLSGASTPTRIPRPKRFLIREISREGDL